MSKHKEAQLAERAPASADTDDARKYAAKADSLAHEFGSEGYDVLMEFSRLMYELADVVDHGRQHRRGDADALDASRAECERLRELLDAASGQVVALRSICPWCAGDMQDGICQTCGYTRIEATQVSPET